MHFTFRRERDEGSLAGWEYPDLIGKGEQEKPVIDPDRFISQKAIVASNNEGVKVNFVSQIFIEILQFLSWLNNLWLLVESRLWD